MALSSVPSLRELPEDKQLEKIHKYLMSLKNDLEFELSELGDAANQVKSELNLKGLFEILGIDADDLLEWDKIKEITDNVGKVIGEKISGMIDLANTRISTTTAHIAFDEHGIFIMDKETIEESTWAMQIGPAGFRIAKEKLIDESLNSYSWDWATFGTGEGFSANCITAGELYAITINACDILAANITSGNIKGVQISACTLDANTITGGTIKGSTIEGNTIKGGTITGSEIIGGSISGNTITGASISTGKFNATNMEVSGLVVGSNVTMGPNATISWNNITDNKDVITIANIANNAITQMPEDVVYAADLVWEKLSNKPQDLVTFTDLLWEKIIGAPDIPSVALQAIKSTYIDAYGVWTPSVYATRINTLYGKISTSLIENLVVGSNVTMGPYATISWANVSNKPTIPATDAWGKIDWSIINNKPNTTYIDSNGVYTGTVAADKIIGTFTLAQYSKVEKELKINNGTTSGLSLQGYYGRGEIDFYTGSGSTGCKTGYINGGSYYEIYTYYGTGIKLYSAATMNITSGSTMNITSNSSLNISSSGSTVIDSGTSMRLDASGYTMDLDASTIDARGSSYGYFGSSQAYVYGTGYSLKLNASSGISTTGKLAVSGTITATGTKPATVLTENYGYRQLFSEEADKVYFSTKGLEETHLTVDEKYQYIIRLDPVFLQTIEPNSTNPYLVFLTPYSDARVWVKQVYDQYIIIESDKATRFTYDVKCLRKNYSDYYLREVDFRNGEF